MTEVRVRYIVDDVDSALGFYRDLLGFSVDVHPAPGFAALSRDGVTLLLNAPGSGGAGTAGGTPEPGGWNRIQVVVDDLEASVGALTADGASFRSGIVHGMGGDQALVEDPAGNLVELFQPHPADRSRQP